MRLSLTGAESVEACGRVRLMAVEAVSMAEGLGDDGLAFDAAVVVAMCSYAAWAVRSYVDGRQAADRARLGRMVDDLLAAAGRCRGDVTFDAVAALAELAVAVVDKANGAEPELVSPLAERLALLRHELGRITPEAAACGAEIATALEQASAGLQRY